VFNQPPSSTQPGYPSVGRHNEYWRWFRPSPGKKQRFLRNSRSCDQDCRLKTLAVNWAGHVADVGCMLASLGLGLRWLKVPYGDELPHNGPCCPCETFFFFYCYRRINVVGLCLCVCVCWLRPWSLQKWMNQLRSHLGCRLTWTKGTVYYINANLPTFGGIFPHLWSNSAIPTGIQIIPLLALLLQAKIQRARTAPTIRMSALSNASTEHIVELAHGGRAKWLW